MERQWQENSFAQPAPDTAQRASLKQRSLGILVIAMVIGFIVAAGSVMAFYFLPNPDLLFGEKRTAGDIKKLIHVEFGRDEFIMPEPVVRSIDRTFTGNIRRIELRVPWPFSAEATENIDADDLHDISNSLFLSFEPQLSKLPPQLRLESIYRRFLDSRPPVLVDGLLRYRFKVDSPYPGIELFVGALRGKHILFLCEPVSQGIGPALCEREIPLSGNILTAHYRFHRSFLADWHKLEKTANELITAFRHPLNSAEAPGQTPK